MKTRIDLATWKRREHFAFFMQMDEPFHGVVTNLDCTWARAHCRELGHSFFHFYLHKILHAVNDTPAMRMRLEQQAAEANAVADSDSAATPHPIGVVQYAQIHANATIARADHTFGFCAINFEPDFAVFSAQARPAMQRVIQTSGLCVDVNTARADAIHFSVLPHVRFTGLTHARRFGSLDSAPKITVGACFTEDRNSMLRDWLPVATFAHHALVDGHDVGLFLARLQQLLDAPGVQT